MKKKLAVLLTTVFAASTLLVGCGKDISGKYSSLTSFRNVSTEAERAELENEGYGFLLDTEVELDLNLKKDGSYEVSLNSETTKASIAELMDVNADAVYNAYTGGDPQAMVSFYGLDSVDDVRAIFQETYDEHKTEMVDSFMAQLGDINEKGSYVCKKDTVTISSTGKESFRLNSGSVAKDGTISLELIKSDKTKAALEFKTK